MIWLQENIPTTSYVEYKIRDAGRYQYDIYIYNLKDLTDDHGRKPYVESELLIETT